jgi:excisionase family DNA binding protein
MNRQVSAEDLLVIVQQISEQERMKFFSLVGKNLFGSNELTHEEVFSHLKYEHFSSEDAAKYLEISLPTLRRFVSSKKIKPTKTIGRSQLFSAKDLRQLKQKME